MSDAKSLTAPEEEVDSKQFSLFEAGSARADGASPPAGRFSNFVVYVDESGDHGMQTLDPSYPLFVLAFCVFYKRHYSEKVVPALHKFKFNHFGTTLSYFTKTRFGRRRALSSSAIANSARSSSPNCTRSSKRATSS